MERLLFILGLIVLVAIGGLIASNAVRQPVEAKHRWVYDELAKIKPMRVDFPGPNWDFNTWHKQITGKSALWTEIVPPPPPPPPPKPKPPDIKAKLSGVQPLRAQVGKTVKIKTKENPKGSFYGPGDRIAGCTIKEITKEYVEFYLIWRDQELTTRLYRK